MGRASSSKKVARAAGTGGGRTASTNTPWGYIAVIALVVVVGVALTVTSRSRYVKQLNATTASNATVPPTVGGAAWHEGYVVDICGTLQKGIVSTSNYAGFTTKGNGVITIAPKTKSVAGKNATLGVFAKATGMTLTVGSVGLPGARKHVNGQDCGSKAGRLYVKTYAYPNAPGVISKTDPTSIRLVDDGLVTIAFVPPSQRSKIPAPPASVRSALSAVVSPTTTTTTTAPATSTTTGSGTSTTTGSATSTTTGSATSTTGSATTSTTSPATTTTSPSTSTTSGT